MKILVLCMCLAVGCLAQRPHPCRSPPLLTGSLSVSTTDEKLMAYAKYSYDAYGQRIRFREIGSYVNKTFHLDALLLFKEGVMYTIDHRNRTCKKQIIKASFHPMEIPQNSTLLGQVILGSSSGPGQGLLVNSWFGELKEGKYLSTVTEFGCLPISTFYHTQNGWMVTNFFNIVIGIEDPHQFFPPPFCKNAKLEDSEGEKAGFYSLFFEEY